MENLLVDNIFVELALVLLAGVLLGVFFFAGLWWTVSQLKSTRHVALLFIFSLLFRSTIVIVGFYFIAGENWHRLLAGLLGFMLVRLLATRYTLQQEQTPSLGKTLIVDKIVDKQEDSL
ncbi:ATP synthase subunit I [Shewanella sp. SG41-4]|uniref:ATP synthase subunit I n=1 Tax=Shewanella sp. SG41-4 TaxID=2760976 RepID=UPI0015FFF836|nr:ATP synthase subunit I [Shewanella sp. SG41-4]MBB1437169.1 ATP synthase subunit I [Shewanella sp. SG41-4]